MKDAQGEEIRPKTTWELQGGKCTKYFFKKLEKRKNTDQAMISLNSRQNSKMLKGHQKILTEVKAFYEQIYE